MIALHAGKVLHILCAGRQTGWSKRKLLSLRPVLAFQPLTLATLGKWATTHDRVSFMGKNCSWTLLPGSTWLRTPTSSKLQNTFCFFKTCWWLTGLSRLYDASQPPGSYARYFKIMLKILVDGALSNASHLFFLPWYFSWCVVSHVTITRVNNLFPGFRSICCGISFWHRYCFPARAECLW